MARQDTHLTQTGAEVQALLDKVEGIEAGAQVNDIEVIKVNGVAQTVTDNAVDIAVPENTKAVTYAELVALRNGSHLVPGQYYRITDYVATTTQTDTRSANHPFDIIVVANTTNTLSEEGRAAVHSGETYFTTAGAKLVAWKVWYTIDNDATRFSWADATNGKGVIYRLIDEWDNDLPYDFKGVQFKRYEVASVTPEYSDALSILIGLPIALSSSRGLVCGTNYKWYYTFSRLGNEWTDDVTDASIENGEAVSKTKITSNLQSSNGNLVLNNNVFADGLVSFNFMKTLDANTNTGPNTISFDNVIDGGGIINNTVIGFFAFNKISSAFRYNTIIGTIRHSNIGSSCQSNTLVTDKDCGFNTIAHAFRDNVIRINNLTRTNIGNHCQRNYIFLSSVIDIVDFGEYFSDNTITGTAIQGVSMVGGMEKNVFTNIFLYNCAFGPYFYYNELDGDFRQNTFGNAISYVTFAAGTGGTKFAAVDVAGNIKGAPGSKLTIQSSAFLLSNTAGIKRRVRLDGDADGNLIATWKGTDGKETGIISTDRGATWTSLTTPYYKPASGIPASDLASGVIPDVSNFITKSVNDLTNYYLKSETYTKSEVESLIGAISQFHYEIAASTSAVASPASNVLYLIGPTGSGADKYEEYVYTNSTWTKIGDTSVDLSGYVTTSALNTALADYTTTANLTTLLAGKQNYSTGTSFPANPQEGDVFVLTGAYVHDIDSSELSTSGFFQDPYLYYTGGVRGTLRIQLATSESTPSDCWVNAGEYYEFQNYNLQSFTVPNTRSSVAFLNSEENRMFATSVLSFQYPAGVYEYDGNGWTPMVTGEDCVTWNNKYEKPYNGIPKADLASGVQTSLGKADTALQSFTETDPTVPSWAKASSKPSYDYSEIDNTPTIPDAVEANPTVPSGTTPTALTGMKIGNGYYDIEAGGGTIDAEDYSGVAPVIVNPSNYYTKPETETLVETPVASTQPSGGFLPNVIYDLGEITGSVTFALATPTDNTIANTYVWTFETGSTAPTVAWPSNLTWLGGSAPTINTGKHYEITVRKGYANCLEF